MSQNIELDDLSKKQQTIADDPRDTKPGGRLNLDTNQEQAVTLWAYVATALLGTLASLMVFFPSFMLYAAETSAERRMALTPLESFLSLHCGILLGAYALALLFNVPNATGIDLPSASKSGHPLLLPLTLACGLIAFLSYNATSVGALAFIVFLGSATIAAWGGWTIMFSGTSYISRKTGADKRTSRFLFGNKAAASSQKSEWRKGQQSKSR